MMLYPLVLLTAGAMFLFPGPLEAQRIYRCVDQSSGKINFTDRPCHGSEQGGRIAVRPNVLDSSEGRATASRLTVQQQSGSIASDSGSRSTAPDRAVDDAKRKLAEIEKTLASERLNRKPGEMQFRSRSREAQIEHLNSIISGGTGSISPASSPSRSARATAAPPVSRGAIDPYTGQQFQGVPGGVINPSNSLVMPSAGPNTYFDTESGRYRQLQDR